MALIGSTADPAGAPFPGDGAGGNAVTACPMTVEVSGEGDLAGNGQESAGRTVWRSWSEPRCQASSRSIGAGWSPRSPVMRLCQVDRSKTASSMG
ncbi:hypothetical protein [Brucella anthropi]|uniref:hypothetical protein n=2 Tax=Brucella TaxID=234 RepID=UPI00178C241C|nr:hypothetical protein [Brucella anthropi]